MRFSYAESMCDPAHYLPLARAAEEAGFTSFVIPDSICYPEVSDSRYPYTPDGERTFIEDKPFIEPFALIPAMAAVTTRLRFTTFVVKLPIRHPVLVAKQAASVAIMSQDRFGFGVGTSPWPEDFLVTGTEWKTRGARLDEMIAIMRGLSGRRLLRVPRQALRLPAHQDLPDPGHAHPDPDRRPLRGGAASAPRGTTAGCTRAATRRCSKATCGASTISAASTAAARPAVREPRDLASTASTSTA